jgi:hypothetical protein
VATGPPTAAARRAGGAASWDAKRVRSVLSGRPGAVHIGTDGEEWWTSNQVADAVAAAGGENGTPPALGLDWLVAVANSADPGGVERVCSGPRSCLIKGSSSA